MVSLYNTLRSLLGVGIMLVWLIGSIIAASGLIFKRKEITKEKKIVLWGIAFNVFLLILLFVSIIAIGASLVQLDFFLTVLLVIFLVALIIFPLWYIVVFLRERSHGLTEWAAMILFVIQILSLVIYFAIPFFEPGY